MDLFALDDDFVAHLAVEGHLGQQVWALAADVPESLGHFTLLARRQGPCREWHASLAARLSLSSLVALSRGGQATLNRIRCHPQVLGENGVESWCGSKAGAYTEPWAGAEVAFGVSDPAFMPTLEFSDGGSHTDAKTGEAVLDGAGQSPAE